MKWFWTSYIPFFTSPLGARFWGSWNWLQMISLITLGQKHWTKKTFYHVRNQSDNFMPSSCPWSPTAPRPCSWPPINLRFLKLVWNDSPNRKTLVWYQNYVSSTIRTKVTISLHEVVLGLLQTLHPVLGLQIDLRLLKIVSNDSPYPKTFSLIPKLFL